ncbi:MAG: hypothetical protein L6R35_002788 [Caloplaca aegaea]|nr:MAG: hypothetical protein L6R35_002788 [Caloplaca aegaea]
MAERFLISYDPYTPEFQLERSSDLKAIFALGNIFIHVKPNQFESAIQFLKTQFGHFTIFCNAGLLENVEDVISLLDNGATRVFVSYKHLKEILEGNLLESEDISRLVLCLDQSHPEKDNEDAVKGFRAQLGSFVQGATIGIYAQHTKLDYEGKIFNILRAYEKEADIHLRTYVAFAADSRESYLRAVKDGHVPIIAASSLTTEPERFPDRVPAHLLLTAALRTDRADGLYTTVVSDERGICLGLVYSNEESIRTALKNGSGVYYSRSRNGLWFKGATSGDTQQLMNISLDCDGDALLFTVRQKGNGFCHLHSATCFGPHSGLSRLQQTLQNRKTAAPPASYTARLFREPKLLQAKVMEEASELCDAVGEDDVAAEAADLLYFAMVKCIAAGVDLSAVEKNLDLKNTKTTRRNGDAKQQWAQKVGLEMKSVPNGHDSSNGLPEKDMVKEAASVPKDETDPAGLSGGRIQMQRYKTSSTSAETIIKILQRPSQRSTDQIMKIVNPIIGDVRSNGDVALLRYTHRFEKATSLTSPVLKAPFPSELMQLPPETIEAIDISFENIRHFHAAQKDTKALQVETMPGVICSRFSRPIARVGLYVPGGTAVLPSTALMLGVPAMVAGCKHIVLASPPRSDGTITPEIVYIAHKVGAESIVLAGGAQAVAALAYGTESIPKVDKILGPGNQFVTAGKMIVSNDTTAGVSIDMPAGPSEVLVVADRSANPAFVASDLLSQAEHGTDSQVVLIAVGLEEKQLGEIEAKLHAQADALPRVDVVRGAIAHSVTLEVSSIEEAMALSNQYAPEHLILQVEDAASVVDLVENAGSVFIGPWTPESVGDYSAGVNHSLPTYGYAKQYSGVNLSSFTKHITSSYLTREGLQNVSGAVMQLAKVEELEAHRRAVSIRLEHMDSTPDPVRPCP